MQQIQVLEREMGFYLLERKNRKFTLTPAGEYFYKKSLGWLLTMSGCAGRRASSQKMIKMLW